MNVFKLEQNLMMKNSVAEMKTVPPTVTFDANTDISLSFFDSPSPNGIKKEIIETPNFSSAESSVWFHSTNDESYSEESKSFGLNSSSTSTSPPSMASSSPMPAFAQNNKKLNVSIKTEQNFQVADSTPTTSPVPPKTVVSCKVCGDKASGYHYGVTSCEGCKGFFRRSIQKQIEYRCLRDGKCLVIRLNRNRCQFCRFRKCLSVGMSRDSVRYGRVPRRNRERESSSETRSPPETTEDTQTLPDNKPVSSFDIIMAVSQAHHSFCLYTEERTKGLIRKPIVITSFPESSDPHTATSTADALDQAKVSLWDVLASAISPSIQKIVEFAKRVPGFIDLSQDDQLILIKGGFFELWLTRASRMISSTDNTFTFSDGSFLSQHQMDLLFDDDFSRSLFNFASTLNNLCLNDTEVGLFAAVILLTGDRPGIQDTKVIEQLQDRIIEALKVQMTRNHPGEPHLFTSLAMKLPELKQIGQRSNDHLDWLRANCNRVSVSALFSEIFDIPNFDEAML